MESCVINGSHGNTLMDSQGRIAEWDNLHKAILIQTIVHTEIHEGNYFDWCYETTSLNSDDTKEFIFVTPNSVTKLAHFNIPGLIEQTKGSALLEIYEDVVTTNDGSAVTVRDHNINTANTPDSVVTEDPTITSDGTLKFSEPIGTGQNQGGQLQARNERVFKSGATKYLIRITSRAASNIVSGCPNWYEHTGE